MLEVYDIHSIRNFKIHIFMYVPTKSILHEYVSPFGRSMSCLRPNEYHCYSKYSVMRQGHRNMRIYENSEAWRENKETRRVTAGWAYHMINRSEIRFPDQSNPHSLQWRGTTGSVARWPCTYTRAFVCVLCQHFKGRRPGSFKSPPSKVKGMLTLVLVIYNTVQYVVKGTLHVVSCTPQIAYRVDVHPREHLPYIQIYPITNS